MIDAHVLVVPKMNHGLCAVDAFRISRTDTLYHFPDVAQIESVMTLGGRRQQFLFGELKDLQAGVREVGIEVSHSFWESAEVEVEEGSEYAVDDV